MKVNIELRNRILTIVAEQISTNNPPEVKKTYLRLQQEGFDEMDSKKLIGQCVALELYEIIKNQNPFNLERYIKNLTLLPNEPEV